MTEVNWTASQKRAIQTTDQNVLVSAAAGSGKTAVLAERCAYLVSDAKPACGIDELLVVTFTNAAAAEMRERVGQALRKRLSKSPTNAHLKKQLVFLDAAQISTIHAFCRRVLNRFFALADLDPQAPLLDAQEAVLLRQEIVKKVFDDYAERDDHLGEAFLDFLAAYGSSSEQSIRNVILAINHYLTSLTDPDEWLEANQARFDQDDVNTLSSFWMDQLQNALVSELREQIQSVEHRIDIWQGNPTMYQPFLDCLEDYNAALCSWIKPIQPGATAETLNQICSERIKAYNFPATPRKGGKSYMELDDPDKAAFDSAHAWLKDVHEKRFKKRLQTNFGAFTIADWAEGLNRIAPHVRTIKQLVQSFRREYQSAKQALGVVDFSDLERKALNLLRDESNGVAQRLRKEFKHVLVDEFQDVNSVQAKILTLVSHENDPTRPGNLFTVGDVKQSIYRFRLADPTLFLQRRSDFTQPPDADDESVAGRVIDMVDNFRSRRGVIDAVNALFEKLMARNLGGIDYDETARLKCGKDDGTPIAGPALELHVLEKLSQNASQETSAAEEPGIFDWERIEREAYVIAQRINGLIQAGRSYRDIVILLRSMKTHIGLLVRRLMQLDIPVFADTSGNLFESLEVMDVLSLLAVLDNGQQDIPLAAVLRSPLFGRPLSDTLLVELRTAATEKSPHQPFHAAVRYYARTGNDSALKTRLQTILEQLRHWRTLMRRRPVAEVLWGIYEESGYLAYVSGLADGPQRRANLLQLHQYARRFGTFQRQGLYRFLRFIDGLRESGAGLNAGSVETSSADVVRIMTIHRSKGLEFPVVILGELGKRFNLADARGAILFDRRLGIGLEAVDVTRRIAYPTLPHRLVAHAATAESLAEELRILYVALTRAQEKLILVGTGKLPEAPVQNTVKPSEFHGPLPLIERQDATAMLDWVAKAIAAQPFEKVSWRDRPTEHGKSTPPVREDPGGTFEVITYPAGAMADWQIDPPTPTMAAERLGRLSQMQPIEPVAPNVRDLPIVQQVERRLTTEYPAKALTHVPAVVAASVLKRRWSALHDAEQPAAAWPPNGTDQQGPTHTYRTFTAPEFLESQQPDDPAHRGTWTHELLQRLDLSRPCDLDDLRAQQQEQIQAGTLTAHQAKAIYLDDIAWYFSTPLGRRIKSKTSRVLREWPFVLGVDPTRYSPDAVGGRAEDVMLVRGIIDLLFDDGPGWEILDYKTDRISGEDLNRRVEDYAGQLQIYAAAVEAIWRKRPNHCWLVFLHARQIVQV